MSKKIIGYIFIAVAAIMAMLLLSSCYTPQKSARQIEKAITHYPETAAKKTRAAFPCITTSVDSSAYLRWKATIDSILEQNQNEALQNDERVNQVIDSLRNLEPQTKDSLFTDCADENEGLIKYAAKLQTENELLNRKIKSLQAAVAKPSPVNTTVKDSAEIFLAIAETRRQTDTATKYRTLYNQEHSWRQAKEQQEAGNLVVYIPWKWILVIAILLAGWAFIQWRAGGFKKLIKHFKE